MFGKGEYPQPYTAAESASLVGEDEAHGSRRFYASFVIAVWFLCAICLSNALKWLFNNLSFKYPLFVTFGHMLASNVAAGAYIWQFGGIVPTMKTRKRVWLLAAAFILSVAPSNIGIQHVYVSFAMTIGATTPAFTVVMSKFILKAEYHYLVYVSILIMMIGMMMGIEGEINFDVIGCVFCIVGVLFRALKSVLQQLLLTDEEQKLNSVELLYLMTQPCIIITFLWAAVQEFSSISADPASSRIEVWCMYFTTCLLAVGMNLTTFLVTFLTSAVTLQVLGQAKVVMTILLSLLIFHNQLSLLAGLGIATTIGGGVLYSRAKKLPIDPSQEPAFVRATKRFSEENPSVVVVSVGFVLLVLFGIGLGAFPSSSEVVGICITGQVGRLELQSKLDNLVAVNANAGREVDVIVVAQEGDAVYTRSIVTVDDSEYQSLAQVRVALWQDEGITNVDVIEWQRVEDPTIPPLYMQSMEKTSGNKNATERAWTHANQFGQLEQCGLAFSRFAQNRGRRYSVVLKVRDDNVVVAPVPLPAEQYASKFLTGCCASGWYGRPGKKDHTAIMDGTFMEAFFFGMLQDFYLNYNAVNALYRTLSNNQNIMNPEGFLLASVSYSLSNFTSDTCPPDTSSAAQPPWPFIQSKRSGTTRCFYPLVDGFDDRCTPPEAHTMLAPAEVCGVDENIATYAATWGTPIQQQLPNGR